MEKWEVTWYEVQKRLSEVIPPHLFSVWIKPLRPISFNGRKVTLGCPNRFFLNWVDRHFKEYLEQAWQLCLPGCNSVELKIIRPKPAEKSERDGKLRQLPLPTHFLCKRYTFKEFIVGKSNEYAYNVAYSLANGGLEQPLFILSDTGLGKSHLSQAIGNHFYNNYPGLRILYLTTEQFTNEMVCALRGDFIKQFKQKYRKDCDILILEDIHFLRGKEKIQTELAYTLDALWDARKRVVFTSLVPPQNIPSLKKELKSRLSEGLIATIEPPDFDTRLRILRKKVKQRGLKVSGEVLGYIAERVTKDIRALEGAVSNLMARSLLQKRPIDITLAKEVISTLVEDTRITTEKITKIVCKCYKISPQELVSRSRKQRIRLPRNIAIYLCRRYLDISLDDIGRIFNRHHATILHSIVNIDKEMKKRPTLAKEIEYLCQCIEEKTT